MLGLVSLLRTAPVPVKYAGNLATVTFRRGWLPGRCGCLVLATSCSCDPPSAGMLVMTCRMRFT
jgi:hypothetical protein